MESKSSVFEYHNQKGIKTDEFSSTYQGNASWEIPIRGYVTIFIAFITLIDEVLMISVLVFRGQRSPATIVLTFLAICDSIISISSIPEAVYFNARGGQSSLYTHYGWCVAVLVSYNITRIFRMISNWLTALLGFQRSVAISLPLKYSTICSKFLTSISIACIVVASIMLNLYEGIAIDTELLPFFSSRSYNESLPSGCTHALSKSLIDVVRNAEKSKLMFYIISGLLSQILPIVVLIVTAITIASHLKKKIENLQDEDAKKDNNKTDEIRKATKIIFVILVIFLIIETLDGIGYIINAYEIASDQTSQILSKDADVQWDTVSSVLSLLVYAAYFWIFFILSKQFRGALYDIIFARFRKTDEKCVLNFDDMEKCATKSPKDSEELEMK